MAASASFSSTGPITSRSPLDDATSSAQPIPNCGPAGRIGVKAALDAATETLSVRYAMDFRRPAQRYCALGPPAQVAERIREFHAAGVRHIILDLLGPYEQRFAQIARFATEAMPLLQDLR